VAVSWSVGSNLSSRVKKSHVPSMFAVLLVISDGVRVRLVMLPYFLRQFSSYRDVGDPVVVSLGVSCFVSTKLLGGACRRI
jgi:hypothetical protein